MDFTTIQYKIDGHIAYITLNRPDVGNAFNASMIQEITDCFYTCSNEKMLRIIVLSGNGKFFSAGADLQYMRQSAELSYEENVQSATQLATMYETIYNCPVPILTKSHGAVLGGGVGLCAVSDIVIAEEKTLFGLTEVKLGIIPAVIGPYVLAKIGVSQFQKLSLTGERFSTVLAKEIGLIHNVCSEGTIETTIENTIRTLLDASPNAIKKMKEYIRKISPIRPVELKNYTAEMIASIRNCDEGKEGIRAFLEKRKPSWSNQ